MEMHSRATRMDVKGAIDHIKRHTLGKCAGGVFSQLVCTAGMRDYTMGEYRHDGVAFQYGPEATAMALACCHQELFGLLAICDLCILVPAFEAYVFSTKRDVEIVLKTWWEFESYRMLPPKGAVESHRELFFSNVQFAIRAMLTRIGSTTSPLAMLGDVEVVTLNSYWSDRS